jgi:hypothetical protein
MKWPRLSLKWKSDASAEVGFWLESDKEIKEASRTAACTPRLCGGGHEERHMIDRSIAKKSLRRASLIGVAPPRREWVRRAARRDWLRRGIAKADAQLRSIEDTFAGNRTASESLSGSMVRRPPLVIF